MARGPNVAGLVARAVSGTARQIATGFRPRPPLLYTPLQGQRVPSLGTTLPGGRGTLVAGRDPRFPLAASPVIPHVSLHPSGLPGRGSKQIQTRFPVPQRVTGGTGPVGTPGGPRRLTGGAPSLGLGFRNLGHLLHQAALFSSRNQPAAGSTSVGRAAGGFVRSNVRAYVRQGAGYPDNATVRALSHPSHAARILGIDTAAHDLALKQASYGQLGPTVRPERVVQAVGHTVVHPATWGKTARDLAVFVATAPAGVAQAAADPLGLPGAVARQTRQYYGGTNRQFVHRLDTQGGAQAIVDAATLLAPSAVSGGRGLGRVAREGGFGGRAQDFAGRARPDLRQSGNAARAQDLSPNLLKLPFQRLEDVLRQRRVAQKNTRAARRGRGRPGLQPRSQAQLMSDSNTAFWHHLNEASKARGRGDRYGEFLHKRQALLAERQFKRAQAVTRGPAEVVPVMERRAVRVLQSEVQTPHFQRFRQRQRLEVTGPRGAVQGIADLSPHERALSSLAIKGLVPLDVRVGVPHLHALREAMLQELEGRASLGASRARQAADAVAAKGDHLGAAELRQYAAGLDHRASTARTDRPVGVRQIDAVLSVPHAAFTDRLAAFQQREVARTQRVAGTDRGLLATTAEAQPRRGQAFAVEAGGGPALPHPHEQLMAEFAPGGPRHQAVIQARAVERGAGRQGRADVAVARGRLDQARREAASARAAEKYQQGRAEIITKGPDATGPRRTLGALERRGGRTLEARVAVKRAEQGLRAAERAARERVGGARQARVSAEKAAGRNAKQAAQSLKPAMDHAYAEHVQNVAAQRGFPQAGYVKDYAHQAQVEARGSMALGGESAASKVKRSELSLLKTGRADLSPRAYVQSLNESIKRQANHDLVQEQAAVHSLTTSPEEVAAATGRAVALDKLTPNDWRAVLERRGWDTGSWALWRPGMFSDAFKRLEGDASASGAARASADQVKGALADGFQETWPAKDTQAARVRGVYPIPQEAYRAITSHSGKAGRGLDKFMGGQAYALLGFNPQWEQFQIAANGLLAGLDTLGNPVPFFKQRGIWQQAFSPEARQYAEELFGSGVGHAHTRRVNMGGTISDTGLVGAGRAWREAAGIRYRHLKGKVPGYRRVDGNPLFQLDTAQTNYFRRVVLTNEVKRAAFRQIQRDAGTLNALLARVHHVFTLGPMDQMRRIVDDPQLFAAALKKTDDILGNYVRYTYKERAGLGRFVLFKGFMRYALRTAFYTAPVKHPIIASIVLKLAQLHKNEVDQLLGGQAKPWDYGRLFFSSASPLSLLPFGVSQVPGHKGLYSLDLGRMSPTVSPITDAASQGDIRRAFAPFFSPLAQSAVGLYAGVNPFTHQPLTLHGQTTPVKNVGVLSALQVMLHDAINSTPPGRLLQGVSAPGYTSSDSIPFLAPNQLQYQSAAGQQKQADRIGQQGSFEQQLLGQLLALPKPDPGATNRYRNRTTGQFAPAVGGHDAVIDGALGGPGVGRGPHDAAIDAAGGKGPHPQITSPGGAEGMVPGRNAVDEFARAGGRTLAAVGVKQLGRGDQVAALARATLRRTGPVFTGEGPQHYAAAFRHNRPFAKSGPYQTRLNVSQENAFRAWVKQHNVPFDVHAKTVDYDMRGYFKASGGRAWRSGQHFPDTFKTPYDTTFSRESKYATKDNPLAWHGGTLINRKTGQVVFAPAAKGVAGAGPTPVQVRRRLFAHPQRPGSAATTLVNAGLGALGQPVRGGKPASPVLVRKLARQLRQGGYSTQQIAAITQGRGSVKTVGFPAHTQKGIIEQAAKRHGVPPEVLWGVYGAETNFGANTNTSSAGAQGPFQFMPGTARSLGVNPYNFRSAANGAAKYLKSLYHGDWGAAVGHYNSGPGGNLTNSQTAAYIPTVRRLAKTFRGKGTGGAPPFALPSGGVSTVSAVGPSVSSGGVKVASGGSVASGGNSSAQTAGLSAAGLQPLGLGQAMPFSMGLTPPAFVAQAPFPQAWGGPVTLADILAAAGVRV